MIKLNEGGRITTKKECLIKCFEEAIENNKKYVAVKISMEGFEKPEIIINPTENFKTKLEYYKNAYDDWFFLKTFDGIIITRFISSNSIEEIEQELINKKDIILAEYLNENKESTTGLKEE